MSDSSNLKYDEKDEEIRRLKEELARQKSKNFELENKKSELENKIINIEKSHQKEIEEKNKYKEQAKNYSAAFYGLLALLECALQNKMRIEEEFIKKYGSNFDGAADEAVQIVKTYLLRVNAMVAQIAKGQAMLWGSGNELILDPKKAKEQTENAIKDLQFRGGKYENHNLGSIYQTLKILLPFLPEECTGLARDLLAEIKSARELDKRQKEQKKETRQGRVINKHRLPRRPEVNADKTAQPAFSAAAAECPSCKGSKLVRVGELADALKTALNLNVGKVAAFLEEYKNTLYQCKGCGRFILMMEPEEDHPILPSRDISTNTIIQFLCLVSLGLPIEKAALGFEKAALLGSNTVSYSIHDYVNVYLKPIYEGLYKALRDYKGSVFADETTAVCLQDQGRGKIRKNAKPSEPRSTNYVLALRTDERAPEQVQFYKYMKTRSEVNIGSIITPDFKCSALVTDAYNTYRNIAAALNREESREAQSRPVLHQVCMVHFRRVLLDAVKAGDFIKECALMTHKQLESFLRNKISQETDDIKLVTVLYSVSNIFRWEKIKNEAPLGSEECLHAHRMQIQSFDTVQKLMEEISSGKVVQKGNRWTSLRNDYLTKACVYYKNSRDELAAFTKDPSIPIDTNPVEQIIRRLATYRKTSFFKHNPEYFQDLCVIMTVFATLEDNGIEDAGAWLRQYSTALYRHMMENRLYIEDKNGSCRSIDELLKKRLSISKDELSEISVRNLQKGFDFQPWIASIFNAA